MQKFASEKLNARLAENLAPNEEVLWTSENCKATGDMMFLYWSHLCVFLFVFALMAITPMKYMFLALFDSSRPFPVFSLIIFVPFTLSLGLSTFSVLRAGRFAYAITDKRLYILNDFFPRLVRRVEPKEIDVLSVQSVNGSGTIFVKNLEVIMFDFGHQGIWRFLMPRKIMNADNVDVAAQHLRALQEAHRKRMAAKAEEEAKQPPLNQGLFKPTDWS